MNSKSVQFGSGGNSIIESLSFQHVSLFSGIIRKLSEFFIRSEIEKSPASYKNKWQQKVKTELYQDIVSKLPVEEKLRLGMYYYFINW